MVYQCQEDMESCTMGWDLTLEEGRQGFQLQRYNQTGQEVSLEGDGSISARQGESEDR